MWYSILSGLTDLEQIAQEELYDLQATLCIQFFSGKP